MYNKYFGHILSHGGATHNIIKLILFVCDQASDGWYWKWLAKWRRKGEEIGVRELGELTQKEREVSCARLRRDGVNMLGISMTTLPPVWL